MVFSVLMVSSNCQAQDMKPYIGIGGGIFAIQLKLNDPLGGSFSQRNPTWGSFIKAGVDVNEYFGGELRVGTTGKPSTNWGAGLPVGGGFITTVPSNVSTKIDHFFSYLGKIQYPVNDSYRIYALLGGTTAKYKDTLSIGGLAANNSYTKTGLTFGGGMEVNLNQRTSIGLEWIEYWTDVTLDTNGSTDKGSFRGISATLNMAF